jgi:hypothetical protein
MTFKESIAILNKALESMHAAEPNVAPYGKEELKYLISRTEAYRDDMQAEITERRAFRMFDDAFQSRHELSHKDFIAKLEGSLKLFGEAEDQAKTATEEYAEIVDYPSDLEALYNLNVAAVTGYDLIQQWMRQVVNFHEGKPYTRHVDFEKLFGDRIKTLR